MKIGVDLCTEMVYIGDRLMWLLRVMESRMKRELTRLSISIPTKMYESFCTESVKRGESMNTIIRERLISGLTFDLPESLVVAPARAPFESKLVGELNEEAPRIIKDAPEAAQFSKKRQVKGFGK